jgi:hypothetical protein
LEVAKVHVVAKLYFTFFIVAQIGVSRRFTPTSAVNAFDNGCVNIVQRRIRSSLSSARHDVTNFFHAIQDVEFETIGDPKEFDVWISTLSQRARSVREHQTQVPLGEQVKVSVELVDVEFEKQVSTSWLDADIRPFAGVRVSESLPVKSGEPPRQFRKRKVEKHAAAWRRKHNSCFGHLSSQTGDFSRTFFVNRVGRKDSDATAVRSNNRVQTKK